MLKIRKMSKIQIGDEILRKCKQIVLGLFQNKIVIFEIEFYGWWVLGYNLFHW
jgi:hypothetical protein